MGNYSHVDRRSRFQNVIDGADDPSLGVACGFPSPYASVRVFEEEIRRRFKLLAWEVTCRCTVILPERGVDHAAQSKMTSQQFRRIHRFAFLASDDVSDFRNPILFKHPMNASESPGRQLPLRHWNTRIHYDFGMSDEKDICHRIAPPTASSGSLPGDIAARAVFLPVESI
jgi:hypothetical protein